MSTDYVIPKPGVVTDEVAAFLEDIRAVSRKHGMYLDPAYWAKTGEHQLDVRQPLTGRLHACNLDLDVLYPGKEYEDGVELVSE